MQTDTSCTPQQPSTTSSPLPIVKPCAGRLLPVHRIPLCNLLRGSLEQDVEILNRLAVVICNIRQDISLHQQINCQSLLLAQPSPIDQRVQVCIDAQHVFVQRIYAVCRKYVCWLDRRPVRPVLPRSFANEFLDDTLLTQRKISKFTVYFI